jgi:murein DD-endopeptidase MepM/ murein hydrolase activator NlpD
MKSTADLTGILKNNQSLFHRVVPYNADKDKLLLMDFTAANTALTDTVLTDIHLFSAYVETALAKAGARYGIGGYNENRTVYRVSSVFDGVNEEEEPRRLHLGVDIWGKAGTPVMAPLDASVHSFAFNDRNGDYGGTIILSHQLQGVEFYSLYGHLSLASLNNLKEGDLIDKGKIFAWLGEPAENGHWPPHLHFQLITDPEDWKGDYPGVCKYSERDRFLANCPDPDLILQMNKGMTGTVRPLSI